MQLVRIEAGAEQLVQVARDGTVLHQRLGDIARTERCPDLAQISRIRAKHRGLAPIQPRRHHQRVERIILGPAVEHGQEAVLHALVELVGAVERDRPAIRGLQHHVVQHHVARPARQLRPHVIATLVDHPEAEVFEQRHALRQRNRRIETVDCGAQPVRLVSRRVGLPVEIDRDRPLRPEPLDAGDVLDRALDRKHFGIAGRERRGVGLRQLRLGGCQGGAEPVGPGSQQLADVVLQHRIGHVARLAAAEADDELGAHQRAGRDVGIERRDPAVEGLGQVAADALAVDARVQVARHEHEHGIVAVEAVAAGEHTGARPQTEVEQCHRPRLQVADVDLEQLVARKVLEDIAQRTAAVAVGGELRQRQHPAHLLAHDGHGLDRLQVGGRREQADEAQLADQGVVGSVALDADIIEVGAVAHSRGGARLGDDQRHRRGVERADLRRDLHLLGAAPQHHDLGRLQHAERAIGDRPQIGRLLGADELVVAHAEQREVGFRQPLQEFDRLLHVGWRQLRGTAGEGDRHCLVGADRLAEPRAHRIGIGGGAAHIVEHGVERRDEARARRRVELVDDDGHVAFLVAGRPVAVAGPDHGRQPPGAVALDLEDRVEHQQRLEPATVDLAHHAFDHIRHVVVEDLDHGRDSGRRRAGRRLAVAGAARQQIGLADVDRMPLVRLLQGEGERLAGEPRQPRAVEARQAVLDRAGKQQAGKHVEAIGLGSAFAQQPKYGIDHRSPHPQCQITQITQIARALSAMPD